MRISAYAQPILRSACSSGSTDRVDNSAAAWSSTMLITLGMCSRNDTVSGRTKITGHDAMPVGASPDGGAGCAAKTSAYAALRTAKATLNDK